MDIPTPQPNTPDIYSLGFDKSLNRDNGNENSIIQEVVSSDSQIGSGVNPITSSGGVQVGRIQTNSGFSPFDLSNNGKGTIRRVGPINLASPEDLGLPVQGNQNWGFEPDGSNSIRPTVNKIIYSANTNDLHYNVPTTSAIHYFDNVGSNSVAIVGRSQFYIGARKASLTDGSVNSVITVPVADPSFCGGTIHWFLTAAKVGNVQCRSGITTFCAVQNSGVYTSAVTEIGGSVATSSGTLTGTWNVITGTNSITLQFTPTSSLGGTTDTLYYSISNDIGTSVNGVNMTIL